MGKGEVSGKRRENRNTGAEAWLSNVKKSREKLVTRTMFSRGALNAPLLK